MNYSLLNIHHDGSIFDITPLVISLTWGGDIRATARKLVVNLVSWNDRNVPRHEVPLGSLLILRNEQSGEIIRTVAFKRETSTNGDYTLTAYDHSIYLLKSTSTYVFRDMTPEGIAARVCNDFGIPIGALADTGINISRLILRKMAPYDIIVTAYTEAMNLTGKKYQVKMTEGRLSVVEKSQQTIRWFLSAEENLIDATTSQSIEEMKNSIVITNDADDVVAQVDDPELIRLYGLLQYQKQEGSISPGEAMAKAQVLLESLGLVSYETSVTCLGNAEIIAGMAVEIKEPITGLVGTYYVDTDEHKIEDDQYTMTLKLSRTDEVLKKETEMDEETDDENWLERYRNRDWNEAG